MTSFHFKGFSGAGEFVEGDIEASDKEAARVQVWASGLTPIEINETPSQATTIWNVRVGSGAPSKRDIVQFMSELASLVNAGLPIERSLNILQSQENGRLLNDFMQTVLRHLLDGASLSQTLGRWPALFPPEYVNMLRAGEMSGRTGSALDDITQLMERKLEFRSRLNGALIYPAVLIILAMISIVIVLVVMVPSIAPIFVESGKPLPGGLSMLIMIGDASPIITLGICLLTILVYLSKRQASKVPDIKRRLDEFKLNIPFFGNIISEYESARFARTFGFLLKSGVDLLTSLSASRNVLSNTALAISLDEMMESVQSGDSFGRLLSSNKHFPVAISQVIAIGEETGQLDQKLLRIAAIVEGQCMLRIERAMALITPALTILIALVIGGLVFSVMDAVLSINDLVAK